MKITASDNTLYECDDEDGMRDFMVSYLGDRIVLSGNVGNQMFSYDGEFTKEKLKEAFPDVIAAKNRALLHTRGILNKEKITKNALETYKDGIMSFVVFQQLSDFIKECNCAPSRFLEKLINKGFDLNIIKRLGIYEESPEMVETTRALIDFIDAL